MNKAILLLPSLLVSNLFASSVVLLIDDNIPNVVSNPYIVTYNNAIKTGDTNLINNAKLITTLNNNNNNNNKTSKIIFNGSIATCLDVTPGSIEKDSLGINYYVAISTFDIESKINEGFVANNICTTHITNMDNLLVNNLTFNQDISSWDTSNVTSMVGMLKGSTNFDQDIHNWNVSNVLTYTNFAKTTPIYGTNKSPFPADHFVKLHSNGVTIECDEATSGSTETLNGIQYYIAPNDMTDIRNKIFNGWDANRICTSHVTNMNSMWLGDQSFNQIISSWDTKNVVYMASMFGFSIFNQDISYWNTSNVITMASMFEENYYFNQNISGWNTSSVTDMYRMFRYAMNFNQNISSWKTTNVVRMDYMFRYSYTFNFDLSGWDVNNVTSYLGFSSGSPIENTNKIPLFK